MNSNHVRYGQLALLLITAILAVGDITKVFPFLSPQYATLVTILIVAVGEWLKAQMTPATNQHTPDNTPPAPLGVILLGLCVLSMGMTACQAPTSTNANVVALENPNNIAKVVEGGVQIGATAFLAKNPSYNAEVVAAADALLAAAASNPAGLTASDITAILAKTSISGSTQAEVASYATSALGLFESSFTLQFPTLKPNYSIYLIATADGLLAASGNGTKVVALPVIPWPPVTPTPTPAPAS